MAFTTDAQLGTAKEDVLQELGESALVLPSLLNRALEANERAKYFLALLQTARAQADAPTEPPPTLRDERLAAGVADPLFDGVVGRAERSGDGLYRIPMAGPIHEAIAGAVREMLAPLAAEGDAPGRSRLDALLESAPDLGDETVPGAYIDQMTAARRERGDSLHLLIMDAHLALNRLQRRIATSTLDGAAVYGLAGEDPGLVSAFMAGVRETAPLKFDHPGLSTTATRVEGRLLIQNDLGTTSAHVVVLAIEGLRATLTHTDVHRRRLEFFDSLVEDGFAMKWSDPESRDHPTLGEHHLVVGTFDAEDEAALEAFLRHVGSVLVFVIDWNRARKRLRALVGNDDAIALLRWSADNRLGHMAFLSLGGERLIYDALELAEKAPARYGEPIVEVLGRDETLAITRFAMRAAAEGLLSGKSLLLIRDELRVEVLGHLQASQRRLLDAAAEHASLIVECANALQGALVHLGGAGEGFLERTVQRAARWEHRADEILLAQRQAARHVDGGAALATLTSVADDAIDAIEEVVFLLTLLPSDAVGTARPLLEPLATITTATAREHLRAVEIARQVVGGSAPEDLEDFLVAVDRVATLEHEADAADRTARARLVTDAPDFRSLYIADCVSRGAEDATDALLRAALGLRDHILGVLSIR